MADYYPQLELSREAFYDLGKAPFAANAGFNMTAFALRMSDYRNGVSKKHGEVARRMWQPLWPDKRVEEVPIDLHHQRGACAHLDRTQDGEAP